MMQQKSLQNPSTPSIFLFSDLTTAPSSLRCISVHHKVRELSVYDFILNTAFDVSMFPPQLFELCYISVKVPVVLFQHFTH